MDYVDETQGEYTPRNPNLYYQGDEWLDWWMFEYGQKECGWNNVPSIQDSQEDTQEDTQAHHDDPHHDLLITKIKLIFPYMSTYSEFRMIL